MEQSADQALTQAAERLFATESVGVLAGSGHVVEFASEQAQKLLGRSRDELVGIEWVGITPPEFRGAPKMRFVMRSPRARATG